MEASVSWIGTGPAVEGLKREIVRNVLEQQSREADEPMFLDAVARAGALADIGLTGSASRMILTLHTVGRPLVDVLPLDDGQRLVIDLHNAVNLRPDNSVSVPQGGLVRHVRASLFTIEPQFVSRVVVELDKPVEYRVGHDRDRVEIHFFPRATPQGGDGLVAIDSRELQRELDRQATRIRMAQSRFEELGHRLGYQAGVIEREVRAQARRGQLTGRATEADAIELALSAALGHRDTKRQELEGRLDQEMAAAEQRVSLQQGQVNHVISAFRGRVTDEPTARQTLADLGRSVELAKDRDFARMAQIEKELWVAEQQSLKKLAELRDGGPMEIAGTPETLDSVPDAFSALNARLADADAPTGSDFEFQGTPPLIQTSEAVLRMLELIQTEAGMAWDIARDQARAFVDELTVMQHRIAGPPQGGLTIDD